MLFRTVYGPELEAIYSFVESCNHGNQQPTRQAIHKAFVPSKKNRLIGSPQNVDDAISFLKSAGLFQESDNLYSTNINNNLPFRLLLLQSLRRIELGKQPVLHPLDSLYITLLTELFIKTDQTIIPDIHNAANELRSIQEAGGLGKEKLQGWMRVMEYVGIGIRSEGNFMCSYSLTLIQSILDQWPFSQGTLQSFFEDTFALVLPYAKSDGDLARAVWIPMLELANKHVIDIYPLQDSPTRPYFGQLRYRGITRKG